jgi:hypothetical protein
MVARVQAFLQMAQAALPNLLSALASARMWTGTGIYGQSSLDQNQTVRKLAGLGTISRQCQVIEAANAQRQNRNLTACVVAADYCREIPLAPQSALVLESPAFSNVL